MHKQHHGGIEVNWTDGEWERLQAIKEAKFNIVAPVLSASGKVKSPQITVTLSSRVYDRIREKAEEYGIPSSRVVRQILEVITDE